MKFQIDELWVDSDGEVFYFEPINDEGKVDKRTQHYIGYSEYNELVKENGVLKKQIAKLAKQRNTVHIALQEQVKMFVFPTIIELDDEIGAISKESE